MAVGNKENGKTNFERRNMKSLIGISKSSLAWGVMTFMFVLVPALAFASGAHGGAVDPNVPTLFGIRVEFILFALVLLGVALFHNQTFWVAVIGLTVITLFKIFFDGGFNLVEHLVGQTPMVDQIMDKSMRQGEWPVVLNLLGLLLGFGILAKIFEECGVPEIMPKYLPTGWMGPAVLLVFVAVISSFLDNIAAALIGGTIALVVFKGKVHVGYIAGIVAASNAGGSGSVVGDTTTTMMWIDGVSPLQVLHGFIAAGVALAIIAFFAGHQQFKLQPIVVADTSHVKVDYLKILIVIMILIGAILTNYYLDMPALGVWAAIILGAALRPIPWKEVPAAIMGTIFLLSLVMCASMMPVETLPDASWMTAFVLGFVSAVFDNIPLTKLCLVQGHYDWGMLAYSVGFGGSMIWFGSSAGVAITNKFPESRNVLLWIRKGWHVTAAYIVGFFVLFFVWGWHPGDNRLHKEPAANCPIENCKAKKIALALQNGKAPAATIKPAPATK
jgi:Na+/H+ antiporter NhaD/arsenite permease-like protein